MKLKNIDNYITSGVLQDYLFGLLTNEEEQKVEIICHQHPRIASELALFRKTMELYAHTTKPFKRAAFRKATWEKIERIWKEEETL